MAKKEKFKKPTGGQLYERYVEDLFKLAGFKTSRNKHFKTEDVGHEIDVIVDLKGLENPIFIECKNVDPSIFNKGLVDAYIGKLTDLEGNYSKAAFFASVKKGIEESAGKGKLSQYRSYCGRKGIAFFNEDDVDKLKEKIGKLETNKQKQDYLLKTLEVKAVGKIEILPVILLMFGIISLPFFPAFGVFLIVIAIILFIKKKKS